ncbi:MAG: four helix bundle protein [Parcubacteria group bacterium]
MPHEPLEKLRIWQDAFELAQMIHELNKEVTGESALKNQSDRSSQSVCDNISEMYGAYYYRVKKNSLRIARKEAYETINHVKKYKERGLWRYHACDNLISRYELLVVSINSYIKYLERKESFVAEPTSANQRINN